MKGMAVYQKTGYRLCVITMIGYLLISSHASTALGQDQPQSELSMEQIDLDLSGEWRSENHMVADTANARGPEDVRDCYAIFRLTKVRENSYTTSSVRFDPPLSSAYYRDLSSSANDPMETMKFSFPGNGFKILEVKGSNFKGSWIRNRMYIPGERGGGFVKAKEFPFEGTISPDGRTLTIIESSALNEGEPLEEKELILHKVAE